MLNISEASLYSINQDPSYRQDDKITLKTKSLDDF